ncbi:MAG: glycosyltransferase [Clostridiales bacterium]|nr:glycosyltransferase [Clostridiales bacterium]
MGTKNIDDLLKRIQSRKSRVEEILTEHNVEFSDTKEEFHFKTECRELKKLKVAAVMDGFTLGNFKSECSLFELTAGNWENEMKEFGPDMLFIESAWNGKDNSWYKKIANGSKELYDLANYCHENYIPVVFWNKEDPVYTDVFMAAAGTADYVFTTDFDCIERYKRTLQHNNVYLLHFSAQPLVHNPIEIHNRKDKFCFAGAYYHRYADRCRVFDAFSSVFEKGKGLDIYDRNLGSARPEHAFPQRYNKMIVGTLKPDDIHIAYKGYNYGINMNSVGQSQSMFARRVFELLASNTVSVGNYARGCKNLFGDLTVCTDSADTMEKQLNKYCSTAENYRKYRLLGLRKVMTEHLCEDRLGFIAQCVFGSDMKKPMPEIVIVSDAESAEDRNRVKRSFERQTYQNKHLVFTQDEPFSIPENAFVGAMSPNDFYGDNYILDLALSLRYKNAEGFGKVNYYKQTESGIVLNGTDCTYRDCGSLFSARSIIKMSHISDIKAFAKGCEISGEFFCTDEFNYCENCKSESCKQAEDIFVSDKGIDLSVINEAAKSIDYRNLSSETIRITPQEMLDMCRGVPKGVSVRLEGCKFIVTSKLKENKTVYLDFSRKFLLDDFSAKEVFSALFASSGSLDVENFCMLYDGAMNELCKGSSVGNRVLSVKVPSNAKYVKLSLRIKGGGAREFSAITAGGAFSGCGETPFLSRSDVLVLADHYPSYDDLYRYMFVHKRNILYKENGLNVDMLCMNMWNENKYREFENINVTDGAADRLEAVLSGGRIKTLCVHFLNPYMWSVIKNYLSDIRLIIWSHGSDIQPWHRRRFNYNSEKEIQEAKEASLKREALWKEVFRCSEKYNIRFVYVSEFFKNQVEEDYGVNLSGKCSIIHNCIDTEMFSYTKKTADMRFKIMTVKSFSSLTYANDITQEAVLRLSREPEFSKMSFDIYGDGVRFEQDTEKIKKFPNVHLHKQFLTQSEIAALHKTHGIYIATTRMDTQGVSRDEAMASGLVPVANAVAAIPEFVNENVGMLVPGEDSEGVAQAILKLVRDPELFLRLSENAAKHVRKLSSKSFTADKETELIRNI